MFGCRDMFLDAVAVRHEDLSLATCTHSGLGAEAQWRDA